MTELPPPPKQSQPSRDVDHFRRFPTGGTQFTRDPEALAHERARTEQEIYPSDPPAHPPAFDATQWFRRMPNGGTVRRHDVDRPIVDATARVQVPEMPNGGGTVNQLPDANASAGEGVSGGESTSE